MDFMTRKRFLDSLLGLGSLGTVFVVAYPLVNFVNPPERSSESGEWVDAGPIAELSVGASKDIMSNQGIPVIVVRPEEEVITALEKKCPHLGCMVDLEDGELLCPCHGAKFTLDGTLISGPSPRGLKQFEVKELDGNIYVGKEQA
ncbi:MAG TPA: Rieske (2Fe-2S) protein [Firmicutes bacterium]|nr:Rieske (2Fe-2S) protein [Bacillota bacterium]